MAGEPLRKLLDIVARLKTARIACQVAQYRDDALSVEVAVPGQRWEIDVLCDGTVDVEVFRSDGTIEDELAIERLIREFSDRPASSHGREGSGEE
jgi:hypothetical protein